MTKIIYPFCNFQLETCNLQPLLQIDQHRPDRIIFEGEEVKVTTRGFSLLYLLAQHKGEVISYDNLLDELWKDEEAIYTRIIQHIYKFRRDILDKIGKSGYDSLTFDEREILFKMGRKK